MKNQFTTLHGLGFATRFVKTHVFGRPFARVEGHASWERIIEYGNHTLRVINCPGDCERYQFQFTKDGKCYGKVWRIRKDSPDIAKLLETIKRTTL